MSRSRRVARALLLPLATWLLAWGLAATRPDPSPPEPDGPSLDRSRLATIEIAPTTEALTFARAPLDGTLRTLLVRELSAGGVRAIDLSTALADPTADPIDLLRRHDFERLAALDGPEVELDLDRLGLPFDGTEHQIAAGVNYPEHGEEVAVGESFLFPKRVRPTAHDAPVPAGPGLLDYELELGFVLLEPLRRGERPRRVGLTLAGDFTDREALVRGLDPFDVESGEGFPDGKSAPGWLPIGNLLVVPRELDRFVAALRLELWRDGRLRQVAEPRAMTWDFARMVDEAFARADRRWNWRGGEARLPIDDGAIPARTLILSGTPGGVIFRGPTARELFVGLSEAFFTGRWSSPNALLEPFLRAERRSGRYLRPGEAIAMRADGLGSIEVVIVDGPELSP